MQIGDICQREVVTIDKSAPIHDAARLMRTQHVGDLVVVDSDAEHRRPLAIVTDRDLVIEVLASEVAPDAVTIGDVASPRTVTARSDADLLDTLRLMSIKGVRRIPVLDGAGSLYGILSVNDILGVVQNMLILLQDLDDRRVERERSVRD